MKPKDLKKYNIRQILTALATSSDGLNFKDLVNSIDLSRSALNNRLKNLITKGLVEKKGGRFGKYHLTSQGNEELKIISEMEIEKDRLLSVSYPIEFREQFGKNKRFTISGSANFELTAIPEKKETRPQFHEEEDHLVIRIPKHMVESSEVTWFYSGIQTSTKKIEKTSDGE